LRHLSRAVPFVLFIALWQGVSAAHLVNPNFLPPASAVGVALIRLFSTHEIFANLGTTVFTCFVGLALGAVVGIPLGAAMALSSRVDGFFSPIIKATYSLPKTALVPLLMLWFGIGGATNVTVVVLAALLPLVVYTYHGTHGVPRVLLWSARDGHVGTTADLARVASSRSAGNPDRFAHCAGIFVRHRNIRGNDRVQSRHRQTDVYLR
jgi:ABC-type nitrate/sulfonate/bicarbonate transport system permease component